MKDWDIYQTLKTGIFTKHERLGYLPNKLYIEFCLGPWYVNTAQNQLPLSAFTSSSAKFFYLKTFFFKHSTFQLVIASLAL